MHILPVIVVAGVIAAAVRFFRGKPYEEYELEPLDDLNVCDLPVVVDDDPECYRVARRKDGKVEVFSIPAAKCGMAVSLSGKPKLATVHPMGAYVLFLPLGFYERMFPQYDGDPSALQRLLDSGDSLAVSVNVPSDDAKLSTAKRPDGRTYFVLSENASSTKGTACVYEPVCVMLAEQTSFYPCGNSPYFSAFCEKENDIHVRLPVAYLLDQLRKLEQAET